MAETAEVVFADATRQVEIPGPEEIAEIKGDILKNDSEIWDSSAPQYEAPTMLGVILTLDATSDYAMAVRKWIADHGTHAEDCEGNRRVRNLRTEALDRGPCTCGLRDLVPEADARLDAGGTREA